MKWVCFSLDGKLQYGLAEGDDIYPTDVTDIYDVMAGKNWVKTGARLSKKDVALAAPIQPKNIICVGLNYHDHAVESNLPVPKSPMIFAKFTNTIAGDGSRFSWKAGLSEMIDYEAELGVVIGRTTYQATKDDALESVFGYVVANDISVRDIQINDVQWVRGKTFDGSCPIGPALVTRDAVPQVSNLHITCTLNGERVQESNTAKMIFSIEEIIAHISQSMTLQPGDLILTGTPHGVGHSRPEPLYMRKGDVVEVAIEELGTLTTFIDGPV